MKYLYFNRWHDSLFAKYQWTEEWKCLKNNTGGCFVVVVGFFVFFCFAFWDKVLQCRPGWPQLIILLPQLSESEITGMKHYIQPETVPKFLKHLVTHWKGLLDSFRVCSFICLNCLNAHSTCMHIFNTQLGWGRLIPKNQWIKCVVLSFPLWHITACTSCFPLSETWPMPVYWELYFTQMSLWIVIIIIMVFQSLIPCIYTWPS